MIVYRNIFSSIFSKGPLDNEVISAMSKGEIIFIYELCRDGLLVSMSASHAVGLGSSPKPAIPTTTITTTINE